MNSKEVGAVAAGLMILALIYVPVDVMFNSIKTDFRYQLIWEVGMVEDNLVSTTPNVPMIFVELVVIAATAFYLGRLFDSLISRKSRE